MAQLEDLICVSDTSGSIIFLNFKGDEVRTQSHGDVNQLAHSVDGDVGLAIAKTDGSLLLSSKSREIRARIFCRC